MGIKITQTRERGLYYRDLKRGRSYFADKVIKGKRLTIKYGVISYDEAKEKFRNDVAAFQRGGVKKSPSRSLKKLTVTDVLNRLWSDHSSHLKSSKKLRVQFSNLADRLGDRFVEDLNKTVIENYKFKRYKEPGARIGTCVGDRTLQLELGILNQAINHAVDLELIETNKISKFCKVKLKRPVVKVMDDGYDWGQEWSGFFSSVMIGWKDTRPDKYAIGKALYLTLYETGMRPSEAFQMRHNWLAEVQDGFWIIQLPAWASKTKEYREIPVSDSLFESLKQIHISDKDDILMFPSPSTGGVLTESGIKKSFKSAIAKAGLTYKRYDPYTLRRTRTTIWDSIDEGAARAATGHSPQDSHRKHYVRITYERLFKLVGKDYKVLQNFKRNDTVQLQTA